jgi:SPP1 gp7 family putative phage head morphogenesis protein
VNEICSFKVVKLSFLFISVKVDKRNFGNPLKFNAMYPYEKNKTAKISEENGERRIHICFSFSEHASWEKVRIIPNIRYNQGLDYWTAPLKLETLESLIKWGFILDSKLLSIKEALRRELNDVINSEIKGLKGQLFPYQREGVAFIERNNGKALICDEMGLGKTIQILAWLQKYPEKRPVIILVSSSLVLNWKREAEQWMSNPKVEILSGSMTSLRPTGEIIIIDYDILSTWVNNLKTLNLQVLIMDEAQYIKDKTADQTKAVKKLGKGIPHIIGLSGMSIATHPVEAYNAIKLINPELFPSFAKYSRRYGDTSPTYFGWESYGLSSDRTSLSFRRSEEKLTEFMRWLQDQVNKGLIEIGEFEQIGEGIEAEWTNKYIADSYKRKEMRSRYELTTAGIKVPSTDDSGIKIGMSTPFHLDRVGLLFTRVFSDLSGITDIMDAVISRILAQGMADGDGPELLARKMEAAINGSGLGDLGISDTFITDSIDRHISAKRRAQMLAHTEMMRAYHRSSIQEYRSWADEGINVQAEWNTAGDNRVCDICKAMEGKIFSLEEIEGMIPLHPECRCITLPYIEELHKDEIKPIEEIDWLGLREGINTKNSHIPELYQMLTDTIMIRRLKQDVIKDLPNKIYSFVPIKLENINEYSEAERDFKAFANGAKGLDVAAKVSNIDPNAIEVLMQLIVKGKLSQSLEWIKNFLEVGTKVVILTTHQFVIEAIYKAFQKVSVKIDGSVISVEKQKAVDDFQTKTAIRLIIGDINAIEDRIILTAASHIAFLEIPWSPGELLKAENLFHVTGERNSVNIYYLFGASTIEEKIVKTLDNKLIY